MKNPESLERIGFVMSADARHIRRALLALRSLDKVPNEANIKAILRGWAYLGLENRLYDEDATE